MESLENARELTSGECEGTLCTRGWPAEALFSLPRFIRMKTFYAWLRAHALGNLSSCDLREQLYLVDGPCKRQPGALTAGQRGALVADPCAVTSWQSLDVHIQRACLQHPPIPFFVKLRQQRSFCSFMSESGLFSPKASLTAWITCLNFRYQHGHRCQSNIQGTCLPKALLPLLKLQHEHY